MSHKGFSHIGLSTRDLDSTRDFYENVMGFKAVRCDIIKVAEGGQIRHIFFDTGRDQLLGYTRNRDWQPFDRSIDIRIARLRRKIEADPEHPQIIKTIRNAGYMYMPKGR